MSPLEEIDRLLTEVVERLNAASELVIDAPLEPTGENARKLSSALAQVFEVQILVYKLRPDLGES